ncbi:M50 family metallopeptidase [Pelagicoccus sp. SDUM812003]|uniref:M50 family metallopeptidase n=1 Tax=Pelagicoccus sp. SDUM812003 TaxID=3041267 RepID=UPI00280C9D75|nr:M50 family metallopeptidase [Pelagicoccus sp. SDUM812003]MDQ8204960.1 M50 family metallopeptidase [Pelagicoccus sp. SDUM812003]
MDEAPLLWALVKFAWLGLVYWLGLGVAVVAHELGHAVMALLVTRQKVSLQVGQPAAGREGSIFTLGRLELRLSPRRFRYGFTRYDRAAESRARQTWVALAGPAASLLGCGLLAALATNTLVGSGWWILWLGLFVSHFRILIVSVWPLEYRPQGAEGEVWLSDSLDIWRMWRK